MSGIAERIDIIRSLKKEVFSLQQGSVLPSNRLFNSGLGVIDRAFPSRTFPIGAVHELISNSQETNSATNGFISGLLSSIMEKGGVCLWVSTRRTLFPPAMVAFGVTPDRIVFLDVAKPKEALWTIEEALKCDTVTAVIGELQELNFTDSRRLQLAVEESRVTGFIHRYKPRCENTVACVTRWKISPLRSDTVDGMPGVGYPKWYVQLTKVRNGKPGAWPVAWYGGAFHILTPSIAVTEMQTRKAG